MVCIFGRTTKEIKIHVQLRNFSVGIFIKIKKYYYGDPNRCVEIEIVVVYFKCLLQRSKKKVQAQTIILSTWGKPIVLVNLAI